MSTRRTIKFFKKCADETPKFEYSGQPIGKVESIVADETGIKVTAIIDKEPKLIGVSLRNATVSYDGFGDPKMAFFEQDDEALIPVLQHADIKKRPSELYDLLTKAEKNTNITALPKDVVVLKCSTCGHMYEPIKKLHYIAAEVIGGMFAPETIQYWDAYDCPRCGTQKLVSERKAKRRTQNNPIL